MNDSISTTDMKRIKGQTDMDDEAALHSEKVRNLLGGMPRSLTVWGIAVTAMVFLGLLAALCLIPYPYSNGESIICHILNVTHIVY